MIFNEAAREAAARGLARQFDYEHVFDVLVEDSPHEFYAPEYWRDCGQTVLNAALDALSPRSKAILALAELSDEELVERAKRAIDEAVGGALDDGELAFYAGAALTALGLPVDERGKETR